MIAAVAGDVDDLDDSPVLQLAQAVADVGAGDAQSVANFLRVERFFGGEEQGVDLRDGAVDAPLLPHLAPMEDEVLEEGSEVFH